MVESLDKAEALFQWAEENDFLGDPERIRKLSDEASRRWGHIMTRYRISEIVTETLRKIE